MRFECVILSLALLSGGPAAAGAGEGDSNRAREAHALSREVMSPYCPGRTLADCPSPDAAALRAEIRDFLDSGVEGDAILSRLEERFGQKVVAGPRGFWAWAVPAAVLVLGALLFGIALRRILRKGPAAEPPRGSVDPELEAELDRELRTRGL